MKVNWRGVFPAATTQFRDDQSLDLKGTTLASQGMPSTSPVKRSAAR